MLYHTHLANILPVPQSSSFATSPRAPLKKRFPHLDLKSHSEQELLQLVDLFDHMEIAIDEQTWQQFPVLAKHVVMTYVSLRYYTESLCSKLLLHRDKFPIEAHDIITQWTLDGVKELLEQHQSTILMLCEDEDYEKGEAFFFSVAQDILPLAMALHELVEILPRELLDLVSWEYSAHSTFDGKDNVLGDFIFVLQNLGYFCLYLTHTPKPFMKDIVNPLLTTTNEFNNTTAAFCVRFEKHFQSKIAKSKAKDVYCECLGVASGYQAVKPSLFIGGEYYTPNKTLLSRVSKELLFFTRENPGALCSLDDDFLLSLPAALEHGMRFDDNFDLPTELMVQLVNIKLCNHVFPLIPPHRKLNDIAKNSSARDVPDEVVKQACLLLASLILATPVKK